MTSNVAIGNPAAAPVAPASNAAAPSDKFAGLLNNGGAGALRRQSPQARTVTTTIKNWHRALMNPAANETTKPVVLGDRSTIPVSRTGESTKGSVLGGETRKDPGVPELKGQITPNMLAALNIALTPERVEVFNGLGEVQKINVRTVLRAALAAMIEPEGSPDRIDPKHMDTVVKAALTYAQQTPTALDSPARPAETPTTRRVQAAVPTGTQTTPQVPPVQSARTQGTDPIRLATRMKNFGSSAAAISNPTTYNKFLDSLNNVPISTLSQMGRAAQLNNAQTLTDRSHQYRDADAHTLSANSGNGRVRRQALPGDTRHAIGFVSGAMSKVGAVNAATQAFVPTQMSNFWTVHAPSDWQMADRALSRLTSATSPPSLEQFSRDTVKPLLSKGFIPKGSALSARLEQLEKVISTREDLQRMLSTADPDRASILQGFLRRADADVQRRLDDFAARAVQSRGELFTQSLGTPQTTYDLTIRNVTALRYMKSIKEQPKARFSASKFKAIMADVRSEARQGRRPETEISLTWHRALIERYSADKTFDKGMGPEGSPMREAWNAYKALYGMGPKGMSPQDAQKTLHGQ
jgi:hypothetical protein